MSETGPVFVVLPLVAAAIHAFGFWRYNSQTKTGESKPNFASWAIWSFLAALNALSFGAITSLVVAATPIVGTIGCIGTFVHALVAGKFYWPDWKDQTILAISLVAIAVWYFYSPLGANLILISAIILSFWPSWAGVWADPSKEKSLPWYLWGSAYVLTTFVVFFLNGISLKLAMPTILALVHLVVPAICAVRKDAL